MKNHSANFKAGIKQMGRQIRSIITIGNEQLEEELYHINFSYDGNVLKSVMKKLEVTSSEEIQVGTSLNYKLGLLVGNSWEYMDYGNFYVQKVEKEEDTDNYIMTCYDKLLLSMVEYKGINNQFPMSVRSYIGALCTKLGITFANSSDTFANYNRSIPSDFYADLQYTYRDIFDEIAQVTGSTICINDDDELEIRYITNTQDTITADFLKDVNVEFGEKYGPVNAIVLSRSAESDNVYIRDEDSISQNGLCEIKIKDNQIMNFNDRSDYLPDLLQVLDGLQFHTNDFSSYGITYLELCDRYSIQIGDNTYSCIMMNDEIDIEQGIEENIYTKILEQSETDYSKADKTDRKINQTYLVVDKQNQTIEALAEDVGEYDDRIAQVELDVEGIRTFVEEVVDITRRETAFGKITMENCMKGYLYELKVYGDNVVFGGLYPRNNLYPADDLYPFGSSRLKIWTDNLCRDDNWSRGKLNSDGSISTSTTSIVSNFVEVGALQVYISAEDIMYEIDDVYAYDTSKSKLNGISVQSVEDNQLIATLPQGTKYVRFSIIKNGDEFDLSEMADIKPMVVEGNEKITYCGYNNSIIELGVNEVLRRVVVDDVVTRDEYSLAEGKAKIIRRVGVDSQGNLYPLGIEVVEDLGDKVIPVAEGVNYIQVLDYNAYTYVRYVILNEYTNTFATTIELSSSIQQLADSIMLEVNKKVDNTDFTSTIQLLYDAINLKVSQNNIVASLNLGVSQGQGIIEIIGNLIKIVTDYFKINTDGTIEATGGKIASFNINANAIESENCGMSNNQYSAFWCKVGSVDTFRVTWNGDIACATILVDGSPLIKTVAGAQEIKSCYADSGQLVFTLNNAIWVVLPDGGGSDAKLKKNINDTKIKAREEIDKMRFTEFDWKATDQYQDIGLIAQDLEKINPNLVSNIKFEGEEQKIVNNSKLIFYALKGIQELDSVVKKQQEEIDELKKIINEMRGGEK